MTYGGDALALAAARAVLDEIERQPVIEHLWETGGRWLGGARQVIAASGVGMRIGGAAPRSHFEFDDQAGCEAVEVRALFLQECVKRGVLFGVPIFVSWGHQTADVTETLGVVAEALGVVARALRDGTLRDRLEGPPPEVVFRPAAPGVVSSRPPRRGASPAALAAGSSS
jgi:glutamate-1-semialdehyde aminotransferase